MLFVLLAGCGQVSPRLEGSSSSYLPPQEVKKALAQAGDNRRQLEAVLHHYYIREQSQKMKAAEFLIGNMVGHGTVERQLTDGDGNQVDFDSRSYEDLEQARTALDQLKKKHGKLSYSKRPAIKDIEVISDEYLINNIDLAYETWQIRPWSKDIPFDLFCDFILPYRGTSEPLSDWRLPMMIRYLDVADDVEQFGPNGVEDIVEKIRKDTRKMVQFDSRYYLQPNDQSFELMCRSRKGRCGDITNMMTYGMRANGFPAAYDFTPAWADRDNNHAWLVVLNKEGRGSAKLTNRAAKVYRRTFSTQQASLGALAPETEIIPGWLRSKHYIDVTNQYMQTSDVKVNLVTPPLDGTRYAYLCIFNGGRWIPVHWAEINGDSAIFTRLGRDIAYLPIFSTTKGFIHAAPPFILGKDGIVQLLDGRNSSVGKFKVAITNPATVDADTDGEMPKIVIDPGKNYTLYMWNDDWVEVAETSENNPVLVVELANRNRLFWCVEQGGRRLERIFILRDGQQLMY